MFDFAPRQRALEIYPVEEYALDGIDWVEHLPGDMVRFYLYSLRGDRRILRVRNVFPARAILQMHADNRVRLNIANDH